LSGCVGARGLELRSDEVGIASIGLRCRVSGFVEAMTENHLMK
jgi:hypothetical protein